jgi:signal peptidase II
MIGVALLALVVLTLYAYNTKPQGNFARIGFALIVGGAIGNLIDRASTGYVTDFIDVFWGTYHFWAFNIADATITIGAVLLLLDTVESE